MAKRKGVLNRPGADALNIRTVRRLMREAGEAGANPKLQAEHISVTKTRCQLKMVIKGVCTEHTPPRIYIRYFLGDEKGKSALVYTDGKKRYVRIFVKKLDRNVDVYLD